MNEQKFHRVCYRDLGTGLNHIIYVDSEGLDNMMKYEGAKKIKIGFVRNAIKEVYNKNKSNVKFTRKLVKENE